MRICPENMPTIQGHAPAPAKEIEDTSRWICLKDSTGVLITIQYSGGVSSTALILAVNEGIIAGDTKVPGNASKKPKVASKVEEPFYIWVNHDAEKSDKMERHADANTYTVDSDISTEQIIQFYIKTSDLSMDHSWIQLSASEGSAKNTVSVIYQLDGSRYRP